MSKSNTAKKTTAPSKAARTRKPGEGRAPAQATEKKPAAARAGDERVIRLLVSENPKRRGTACYKRFAAYKDGMTVAQTRAAGVRSDDLAWDLERKFIAIEKAK